MAYKQFWLTEVLYDIVNSIRVYPFITLHHESKVVTKVSETEKFISSITSEDKGSHLIFGS